MDADEENLRELLGQHPLGLGHGAQTLPGEAIDEQGQELLEASSLKLLQALIDISLDRLAGEDSAELIGQGIHTIVEVILGRGVELQGYVVSPGSGRGGLARAKA